MSGELPGEFLAEAALGPLHVRQKETSYVAAIDGFSWTALGLVSVWRELIAAGNIATEKRRCLSSTPEQSGQLGANERLCASAARSSKEMASRMQKRQNGVTA